MIQGISIENFKAFHKTEIHGFEQINLFGGKNNVGKTCLLEALYFALDGDLNSLLQNQINTISEIDAYKNLFHNLNINIPFVINFFDNQKLKKLSWRLKDFNLVYVGEFPVETWRDETDKNSVNLVLDKDEQYPKKLNLSTEFDQADIKGESDLILKTIQIIDPSVSEIKTYATFPQTLFLRKKNEKVSLPLSNYGDAMQKIMRYIITIVKLENEGIGSHKYLLIDEIENGLHYTVHKEFWEMLFKLAIEYNIQIFAATHSREMIEAYAEVAQKPEFTGKAAYFEMFRHIKTNEIAANKFNINTLEFNLENNRPLRGEKSI